LTNTSIATSAWLPVLAVREEPSGSDLSYTDCSHYDPFGHRGEICWVAWKGNERRRS
jgi:hypothetical protein